MYKKDFKMFINESITTIICDIEGTTTPISFVKDTLFPFARKNIQKYLEDNFNTEQCQNDIKLLIEQAKIDLNENEINKQLAEMTLNDEKDTLIEFLVKHVYWQMNLDRKTKSLKQIQGNIWKNAYELGELKGILYEDVFHAFEAWVSQGKNIFIYSSGSVQAQKMLFAYSNFGDLTKYISGNFDTNIGMKIEKESYERILKEIDRKPEETIFLTDLLKEAEASTSIGIKTYVVRRADNPDKSTLAKFDFIENFNQLLY